MLKTISFLVANNSITTLNYLKELIESHPSWRVIAEAFDGLEAVRLAEAYHPDLAILDVVMPGLSGIKAARRIRESSPNTRIIIYTAHHEKVFRRRAIEAGADAFFWKEELNRSTLEALIEKWFNDQLSNDQ
jgi:DNA-binding NarL/FixJ family response regulator